MDKTQHYYNLPERSPTVVYKRFWCEDGIYWEAEILREFFIEEQNMATLTDFQTWFMYECVGL